MLAILVELHQHVLDRHIDDAVRQFLARLRVARQPGRDLLQRTLDAGPECRQLFSVAFDELREGIGDEVLDILEVVGGRRQRHAGLGRHRAMAHGPDAVTDDDAHGGVEDRLAALLATFAGGLAALVLNTSRHRAGDLRGAALAGHSGH
ncbi:hypothetical protein D9M68_880400 [compost metagenome]